MKIIVNTEHGSSIIDTAMGADIHEVIDLFVGALMQECYHIDSIRKGIEQKHNEFTQLNT